MGFTGLEWVMLGCRGFSWVQLDQTGLKWVSRVNEWFFEVKMDAYVLKEIAKAFRVQSIGSKGELRLFSTYGKRHFSIALFPFGFCGPRIFVSFLNIVIII